MNEGLEKLIDLALADGILTDNERQVLQRKAQELGVDQDEFEMVLKAKIHLAQKVPAPPLNSQLTEQEKSKSSKEGNLKKCPSCGAPVKSFTTKCADCGHEFRDTESSRSTKEFFLLFNEIENDNNSSDEEFSFWSGGAKAHFKREDVCNKQISLISSFPVPNTKEDILEFLSLCLPHATKKYRKIFGMTIAEDRPMSNVSKAFKSKCEQIIMKARFSMKDDKKALEEIEYYAKQLKIQ